MSNPTSAMVDEVIFRIKAQWILLTEEDVHQGLKDRDTFLERLCHRHSLGMPEAEEQLRYFEEKYPGMVFERY